MLHHARITLLCEGSFKNTSNISHDIYTEILKNAYYEVSIQHAVLVNAPQLFVNIVLPDQMVIFPLDVLGSPPTVYHPCWISFKCDLVPLVAQGEHLFTRNFCHIAEVGD
jgi:hypothetical protein